MLIVTKKYIIILRQEYPYLLHGILSSSSTIEDTYRRFFIVHLFHILYIHSINEDAMEFIIIDLKIIEIIVYTYIIYLN